MANLMANMQALWQDYTFQTVALGSALLGVMSGVFGSFAVLRKQSLLGDGVSHAALPGVVAAFLLSGSKKTETLLLGALITGLLATFDDCHREAFAHQVRQRAGAGHVRLFRAGAGALDLFPKAAQCQSGRA